MRNRLDQGKRNKAARGELFLSAPIGYVPGLSGEMMLDPDEQVQAVVRRIFDLFATRSVRQVLAQLIRDGVRLPIRARSGANRGQIEWREPVPATVYNVLRHPIYAGAYCYGRSRSDPRRKVPGRPLSGRVRVPRDEWAVLLHDMLPSYISWDQYTPTRSGSGRTAPRSRPREHRDKGRRCWVGWPFVPVAVGELRVVPRPAGGPAIRLPQEQPAAPRPTAMSERLVADNRRGGESTTPGRIGPGGIGVESDCGRRPATRGRSTRPGLAIETGACTFPDRAQSPVRRGGAGNRLVARNWNVAGRKPCGRTAPPGRNRTIRVGMPSRTHRRRSRANHGLASDIPAYGQPPARRIASRSCGTWSRESRSRPPSIRKPRNDDSLGRRGRQPTRDGPARPLIRTVGRIPQAPGANPRTDGGRTAFRAIAGS